MPHHRARQHLAYPAKGWTPADTTAEDGEIVGWWKGDAGAFDAVTGGSACAHGGTVWRWEDQSGNGYHLRSATGIAEANLAKWNSPDGLPFIRWNQNYNAGQPTWLIKPTPAGLYRDSCPIIDGRTGVYIACVIRLSPHSTSSDNFGTVNILHGAPALGQDYDKLSRIRSDFGYRGTQTNLGGVISFSQSRRYVWQKTTPLDDSVPDPYAYGGFVNSSATASQTNQADHFNRRVWFLHASATDRRVPNEISSATWRQSHWNNGRAMLDNAYPSPMNTLGDAVFANVPSNRIIVNDGHWSDYGNIRVARMDVGEIIILDRFPSNRIRLLIEGYLAHRWGFARDLYEAPNGSLTPRRNRSIAHPFREIPNRIALPSVPAWTPMRLADLRGYFAADFGGHRLDPVNITRWRNLAPFADALQGNAAQGASIGSGRTLNGLPTVTMKEDLGTGGGTVSNLQQPSSTIVNATGVSVFVVFRPRSNSHGGSSTRRMMFESVNNTTNLFGVALEIRAPSGQNIPASTARLSASRWLNATETSATIGTTPIEFSQGYYLCVGIWDFANGERTIRLNGAQENQTTGLSTGSLPSTHLHVAIGNDRSNAFTNGGAGGDYCELVWFRSALAEADIEKVEGYLSHKWAIDLPKAHPYSSDPPE